MLGVQGCVTLVKHSKLRLVVVPASLIFNTGKRLGSLGFGGWLGLLEEQGPLSSLRQWRWMKPTISLQSFRWIKAGKMLAGKECWQAVVAAQVVVFGFLMLRMLMTLWYHLAFNDRFSPRHSITITQLLAQFACFTFSRTQRKIQKSTSCNYNKQYSTINQLQL